MLMICDLIFVQLAVLVETDTQHHDRKLGRAIHEPNMMHANGLSGLEC